MTCHGLINHTFYTFVCVGLYENRSQVTNKFKTDDFESDLHKVFCLFSSRNQSIVNVDFFT